MRRLLEEVREEIRAPRTGIRRRSSIHSAAVARFRWRPSASASRRMHRISIRSLS